MDIEQRTRFEGLLEDIQIGLKALDGSTRARDHELAAALNELANDQTARHHEVIEGQRKLEAKHDVLLGRVDSMEIRFELKFHELETQVDRLETKVDRLETRFDRLETKVDGLETKVDGLETKVDGLDVFASDAQRRLKRIETHLQLGGASRSGHASPRRKTAGDDAPPRRKKS